MYLRKLLTARLEKLSKSEEGIRNEIAHWEKHLRLLNANLVDICDEKSEIEAALKETSD